MGDMVIVAYRPNERREGDLSELVRNHVPLYQLAETKGLFTQFDPIETQVPSWHHS